MINIVEAVTLLLPIVEIVPFTQSYMQSAMLVLRDWKLSDKEIKQLIAEKMKDVKEEKRLISKINLFSDKRCLYILESKDISRLSKDYFHKSKDYFHKSKDYF